MSQSKTPTYKQSAGAKYVYNQGHHATITPQSQADKNQGNTDLIPIKMQPCTQNPCFFCEFII